MFFDVRRYFLFCLLVLLSPVAHTQVLNLDKISAPSDSTKKWAIALQAGLNFSSEKKVFDWDTKADITRFMNRHYILSAIFVNSFFSSAGSDIQNAGFVHLRFRDNDTRTLSPEFFSQYQWDNLRGLQSRYLAGANLRIRLVDTKTVDFYAGLGLMQEWERWNFDGVDSAKRPAQPPAYVQSALTKLNQYFKVSLKLFKTTNLTFTNYFQARADGHIRKPRIANFLQWDIPLSKKFSINLNVESIYDAEPIVPINHFYYSYVTGILLRI